jgi:Tol biopolymer transport system component
MSIARQARLALALVALMALGAAPAGAQVFGENKVQYERLEWSVLETPHVRLHYYAQEESLARRLAAVAESVCVEYDGRFRMSAHRPIPILLYSAHHVFQQSNATPELITEAVGGLTELIKGRVLIPHNGSWARLVWVTRHELTHAYMLEKVSQVMKAHHRSQGYLPPLWFTEGIAEFCGTHWDEDAEGLLRDAVLSNRAMPLTESDEITGTVLMYKEGQNFLLYLADRFGKDKVFDILDNWWRGDDFETVFRMTIGHPLKEIDQAWFNEVRRRYYPVVATTSHAAEVAHRLTHHGFYNLGPRILPSGHGNGPTLASANDGAVAEVRPDTAVRYCYFAASSNGIDLMLNEPDAKGHRREHRLLRGGVSPSFESFHLFQSRPDASSSGMIALSSKRGGRDALYLVDSHKRRVVRRIDFPHLVAINDPAIVPGDQAIVFSAQDEGGRMDLYRVTWPGDAPLLERLTNDDYDDVEPDVSPDGRWVVFASDRGDRGGHHGLFRLSLDGGKPEPLSEPPTGDDRQPVYSPDGRWIAFRSTRGGTSDLWVRPAEPSNEARRVTHLIGPATDPDWTSDGKGLLFSGQERVEFQVYCVPFDPDTLKIETEPPVTRTPAVASEVHTGAPHPYQRQLSLDIVQNGVAFDPGLGAGAGGQVALSDVLGNEQFNIFLTNDSERFGNFWDGFEGGITYINQSRRLNYGLGIFRLTQIYDQELDVVRRERRVGLVGLFSYPFSKFTRIEGSILIRHASEHRLDDGTLGAADLVSNFAAFVHDNARWSELGPSGGTRLYLGGGFTRDLASGQGNEATMLAEMRHYGMLLPVVASAMRVQYQASLWGDAQRIYLGGYNSLPGIERRSLDGYQTVLAQEELRFPLLRRLVLALPTAWEFPTVSGVVFAGSALAWERAFAPTPTGKVGVVGFGVFIGGGYYPAFRWNFVWPTYDFRNLPSRPRTQFTIGFNY